MQLPYMHDDGQTVSAVCVYVGRRVRENKKCPPFLYHIQIYRIAIEMHTTKIQTTDIRLERLVHLMPHHIVCALNTFSSVSISEKVF